MAGGMTYRGIGLWLVLLFLSVAALVAHNLLWYDFIRTGFADQGEYYYKSAGLVLREDFWKGLFLTVGDPLTFWFLVAFTTLSLLPHERITFQIVGILTCLYLVFILLYGGTKAYDLYQGTFDNKERVIAIVSAGIGRVLGVVVGAWLAVMWDVYGRLNAIISKVPYVKQIHRLI